MNAVLSLKAPLSAGPFLKISNNLSDVANAATSRSNLARLTWFITDSNMDPNTFGGLGALTDGCLLEIVDADEISILLDFTGGVPLMSNDQLSKLVGVDRIVTFRASVGDDWLPVRFTVANAGRKMRLVTGKCVRRTNRDDLSTFTRFQMMAQGVLI